MHSKTVYRWYFFLTLFLAAPAVSAEDSVLTLLMNHSRAVVSVKAETAVIFGDKPRAFIHKESGQLLINRKLKPVVHERNGTGVIIQENGLIITNAHTVAKAAKITVTLEDQRSFSAEPLAMDSASDLALLRIPAAEKLPFISLADSDQVRLDSKIYSIGGSALLKNTISEGIVSGLGTSKSGQKPGGLEFLQVTFNFYDGDSGSPMINEAGKLIGILSAAATNRDKIAYAVPSNKIGIFLNRYLAKTQSGQEV